MYGIDGAGPAPSLYTKYIYTTVLGDIQWNLSNLDTNGAEESVIVSEVSSFQGLKCMQEWYLGWKNVLFREVSSAQGCPHREGVHCMYVCMYVHVCRYMYAYTVQCVGLTLCRFCSILL